MLLKSLTLRVTKSKLRISDVAAIIASGSFIRCSFRISAVLNFIEFSNSIILQSLIKFFNVCKSCSEFVFQQRSSISVIAEITGIDVNNKSSINFYALGENCC